MLTQKDICILIPTYNRPEDTTKTVASLVKYGKNIGKLMVLDQSKDDKTKKEILKFKKKNKYLEYKHFNILGKNIVLQLTLNKIKKKYKLFFLVDDDIEITPNFYENILAEFNSHPEVKGVGVIDLKEYEQFNSQDYNSMKFKLKGLMLSFCLLPRDDDHKYRILGPYGNTRTPKIERDIRDCEWISGFIMCYRNEVFDDYEIPQRIGYDVSEDIDLGYHTFTKYGKGSLVIPKEVKAYHHYSAVERYPDKKRIFVNHEDHLYFYYRYFNNFIGKIKYLWEIFWINIMNIGRMIIKPNKKNFLKVKYLWQALIYCFINRKRVKNGESRMFLNPDLSLKKEYE